MAALHNSNNIIFANGGDGKFPVSASFVVGVSIIPKCPP